MQFIALLIGFILQSSFAQSNVDRVLKQNTLKLENGSGSVVIMPSGKKYALTNAHVCYTLRGKATISLTTETGITVEGKEAKIAIGLPMGADLCAIEIPQTLAPGIRIGGEFKIGQGICTRGYPHMKLKQSCGKVGPYIQWATTVLRNFFKGNGECESGSRNYGPFHCIIVHVTSTSTMFVRPGSSGSPVVNMNGELVGVVSSYLADVRYEAGSVTFDQIKDFVKDL